MAKYRIHQADWQPIIVVEMGKPLKRVGVVTVENPGLFRNGLLTAAEIAAARRNPRPAVETARVNAEEVRDGS